MRLTVLLVGSLPLAHQTLSIGMVRSLAYHLEAVTMHCHTATCSLQQRTLLNLPRAMAKMVLIACFRMSGGCPCGN